MGTRRPFYEPPPAEQARLLGVDFGRGARPLVVISGDLVPRLHVAESWKGEAASALGRVLCELDHADRRPSWLHLANGSTRGLGMCWRCEQLRAELEGRLEAP
jgi:hypothetical protein